MNGPAIAIEKVFAPSVVSPPCANKIAWKINTIIPRMLTALGPKRIAPSPVPVIWEQLPVTDGIFKDEITNTKAPAIARSVMFFRFSFNFFSMEKNPLSKNGIQITPHPIQNFSGRNPSIICMAFTCGTIPNATAKAALNTISFF